MVSRGEDHGSRRKLSRAEAATAGLAYLAKAEAAFQPTPLFHAIRARCREGLGDKKAGQADTELARQTPPAIALDHHLRGYAAYHAGNKAEAVQQFVAALRLEPTHYWSLMLLGWHLQNSGREDQDLTASAAAYTGCIMKRPDHARAWASRGYTHLRLGLATDALADFSKAIELGFKEAWVWSNRGVVYCDHLHEYDKAVADFSKAIHLKPDEAISWGNRGLAHSHMGQYDKAIADCSKAIELEPENALFWSHRGLAHVKLADFAAALVDRGEVCCDHLHEYDKAVADFSKVIDLQPDHAASWGDRGAAYIGLRQYDKAIADCSKAIDLDHDYARAWSTRAIAYSKLGRYDDAITNYSQAIKLKPDLWIAWGNRGIVYCQQLHQYDKAVEDFSTAIKLNPDEALSWYNRGIAYEKLRQYDKAIADHSQAIRLKADFVNAWVNRGSIYCDRLHEYGKAVADFTEVIKLKPDHAHSWNNRGIAYGKLREYGKAIADHSKAIELKTDFVDGWFYRGNVRAIVGQYDKAVADYTKAIELDPKRPLAWYKQGKIFGSSGDTWQWFLLAMAQWRIGNKADAGKYYDQAIRLMEQHKLRDDGILHLGAEASARLGAGEWLVCWSRGLKHAEAGHWDQATADFAKTIKDKPYDPQLWHRLALLRLYAGDTDGYRKLCADMVQRFRQTADDDALLHVVSTCVLGENAVADFRPVLQGAEKLAARDPKIWFYVNRLGVALYRVGGLEAAVQQLNEAEKLAGGDGSVWDCLFLAMAHRRLGQAEQAKKWLAKADDWMAKHAKELFWTERLQAEVLRREAQSLLNLELLPPKEVEKDSPPSPQRSQRKD